MDIVAGDTLVSRIKRTVELTNRNGVLGSIGGFGGLFDTKAAGYKDPLLVSGTDGVGTKLKVSNFRRVISCSLVEVYWQFRGTFCPPYSWSKANQASRAMFRKNITGT